MNIILFLPFILFTCSSLLRHFQVDLEYNFHLECYKKVLENYSSGDQLLAPLEDKLILFRALGKESDISNEGRKRRGPLFEQICSICASLEMLSEPSICALLTERLQVFSDGLQLKELLISSGLDIDLQHYVPKPALTSKLSPNSRIERPHNHLLTDLIHLTNMVSSCETLISAENSIRHIRLNLPDSITDFMSNYLVALPQLVKSLMFKSIYLFDTLFCCSQEEHLASMSIYRQCLLSTQCTIACVARQIFRIRKLQVIEALTFSGQLLVVNNQITSFELQMTFELCPQGCFKKAQRFASMPASVGCIPYEILILLLHQPVKVWKIAIFNLAACNAKITVARSFCELLSFATKFKVISTGVKEIDDLLPFYVLIQFLSMQTKSYCISYAPYLKEMLRKFDFYLFAQYFDPKPSILPTNIIYHRCPLNSSRLFTTDIKLALPPYLHDAPNLTILELEILRTIEEAFYIELAHYHYSGDIYRLDSTLSYSENSHALTTLRRLNEAGLESSPFQHSIHSRLIVMDITATVNNNSVIHRLLARGNLFISFPSLSSPADYFLRSALGILTLLDVGKTVENMDTVLVIAQIWQLELGRQIRSSFILGSPDEELISTMYNFGIKYASGTGDLWSIMDSRTPRET